MVDGRKLAGLLAEQAGGVAMLGIGVNVGQTSWPAELAGCAVSLRELGATAERLDVIVALVEALAEARRRRRRRSRTRSPLATRSSGRSGRFSPSRGRSRGGSSSSIRCGGSPSRGRTDGPGSTRRRRHCSNDRGRAPAAVILRLRCRSEGVSAKLADPAVGGRPVRRGQKQVDDRKYQP